MVYRVVSSRPQETEKRQQGPRLAATERHLCSELCGISDVFPIVCSEPQIRMNGQVSAGSLVDAGGALVCPGKRQEALLARGMSFGERSGSDDHL